MVQLLLCGMRETLFCTDGQLSVPTALAMEQATPSQQISQMESENLLASRTRKVAIRHSRTLAQASPDDSDQATCQGARNKKSLRWELGLLDQTTGKSSRDP